MKTYDAKDIRNVLLVGHGGAGKTTLLEAMLFTSGAITRMGTVEDGNTVSDHEPEEQRRSISVSLSMAPVEWDGVKINVLDAPGYADFIGDLRSAIRAVDAVIVVVSAVDGVEVQTEAAWELAVEAGLPRAIFVNKLDRERVVVPAHARAARVVVREPGRAARAADRRGARVRGRRRPAAREGRPVPERPDRGGGRVARRHRTRWPTPSREKLMEAVAESDDELIEKYLEEGTLSEEEIVRGVKAGLRERAHRAGDLRLGRQGDRRRPAARRSSPRSSPPRSTAVRSTVTPRTARRRSARATRPAR